VRIAYLSCWGTLVPCALLAAAPALAQPDASTTSALAAPPTAPSDEASAAAFFAEGLALARNHRYDEARQAFLAAYRAHPHYSVLYNVAQAELRLGNIASAIGYLERFLHEGADAPSAELRAEVVRSLAELRARSPVPIAPSAAADEESVSQHRSALPSASLVGTSANVSAVSTTSQPGKPEETPEGRSDADGGRAIPHPVAEQLAPAGIKRLQTAGEASPSRTWGIILTGSGVALLGTAAGMYMWNSARQERWQDTRAELDAVPERELELASDSQLWARAKTNNDLLASIQRVDTWALVAAGVGALTLGAGTWELVTRTASTPPALALAGTTVNWRTTW
jgi:hypothetical protein